jgi:accessory gene regulator protein AgrB
LREHATRFLLLKKKKRKKKKIALTLIIFSMISLLFIATSTTIQRLKRPA